MVVELEHSSILITVQSNNMSFGRPKYPKRKSLYSRELEMSAEGLIRSKSWTAHPQDDIFEASDNDICKEDSVSGITLRECYTTKGLYLARLALDQIYNCTLPPALKAYSKLQKTDELLENPSARFSSFKVFLNPGDTLNSICCGGIWTAGNLPNWFKTQSGWLKNLSGRSVGSTVGRDFNTIIPGGFLHFMSGPENLLSTLVGKFNIDIKQKEKPVPEDLNVQFDQKIDQCLKRVSLFDGSHPYFAIETKGSFSEVAGSGNECTLGTFNTIRKYRPATKAGWYWCLVVDFGITHNPVPDLDVLDVV